MTETARIIDQLRRALEGEAWHGPSLIELLDGVAATTAAGRPVAGAHSIWELVLHLTAWVDAARRRIAGETVDPTPEQDWPAVAETSESHWVRAIDRLKAAHAALLDAVSHLDDSRLQDKAAGSEYSIYFLLHGVVQHDLYHAGQIALLKKASLR